MEAAFFYVYFLYCEIFVYQMFDATFVLSVHDPSEYLERMKFDCELVRKKLPAIFAPKKLSKGIQPKHYQQRMEKLKIRKVGWTVWIFFIGRH